MREQFKLGHYPKSEVTKYHTYDCQIAAALEELEQLKG